MYVLKSRRVSWEKAKFSGFLSKYYDDDFRKTESEMSLSRMCAHLPVRRTEGWAGNKSSWQQFGNVYGREKGVTSEAYVLMLLLFKYRCR